MSSEEKQILLRVVEQYIRTGSVGDAQVNVTSLPDDKTSYVEQTGMDGRSVMLNEYRFAGKIVRAGYSSRSQTVYLSLQSTR